MQTENRAGKPVTRPDSLQKRRAILEAAQAVFLEQGFQSAGVNDICIRAKVSKRTLYKHFKNKYDLFKASMQQLHETVVMPSEKQLKDMKRLSPDDYLTWLGVHFLSRLCTAEQIELHRTIAAEARQFPEIGVAFYDGPISAPEKVIYDYLSEQVQRGNMELKNPKLAASQFLALLQNDVHMKLLFLKRKKISTREIESVVENCVDLFLNGVRSRED